MSSPRQVPSQQDERELVARLAPESPIMFARARHVLRDLTCDGAGLFRADAVADGCAVGGILSAEGVSLNSTILKIAGLISTAPGIGGWTLTETAQQIWAESENVTRPAGTSCIALDGLAGRTGPPVR